MAKWELTKEAENDIDDILQSVAEYTGYVSSATLLWNELVRKFDLIAFMPKALGRKINEDRREAFCRGYRIVYRIVGRDISILTVIHSSRIYPKIK